MPGNPHSPAMVSVWHVSHDTRSIFIQVYASPYLSRLFSHLYQNYHHQGHLRPSRQDVFQSSQLVRSYTKYYFSNLLTMAARTTLTQAVALLLPEARRIVLTSNKQANRRQGNTLICH